MFCRTPLQLLHGQVGGVRALLTIAKTWPVFEALAFLGRVAAALLSASAATRVGAG